MPSVATRIRRFIGNPNPGETLFLAIVAALVIRQVYWVFTGYLNPDEFENLQIVWLLERGVWPYRDYIHTHLPLHNLLLWPIYRIHGPSAELPGLVRIYAFPLTLLLTAQIGWVAHRLANRRTAAWLAIIVFLASPAIGKKLAEVRPDTFAYPCWLAAIAAFVSFTESKGESRSSFFLCAAALGIGLLFSQKGVLLVPALAIGFESQMAHFSRPPWKGRFWRHLAFAAIVAAPMALALGAIFALGIMRPGNLDLLLTGGLHDTSSDFFSHHRILVLSNGALASIAAFGVGFLGIVRARLWKGAKNWETKVGIQALAFIGLVSLGQFAAQSVMFYHVLILPVAVFSVLAARELARMRLWTVLAVIVVAIASPWVTTWDQEILVGNHRREQVDRFQFVLDRVPEDRYVLDMLSSLGTFHPIPHRFLHFRPMMIGILNDMGETDAWIRALDEGRVGAVADFDWLNKFAPAAIVSRVERSFAPSAEFPSVMLPVVEVGASAPGSGDSAAPMP